MFALKMFSLNGASHRYMPKDIADMVWKITKQQTFDGLPTVLNARFMSSKKKKGEFGRLVKMASTGYAFPQTDLDRPIIIMHGLLGSKNNWNSISRALVRNLNRVVYAVDARNHGDSPHTQEFSYEVMVCDLLRYLQDNEIKNPTLIGHSMGGRVCMLLTLMYPHLVKSLVVVDIAPMGLSPSMQNLTKLFQILKKLELDKHLILKEARKRATAQLKEHYVDDKIINFLLMNLVENEQLTNWRWRFNLDAIARNFEREICRFPVVRTRCDTRTLFVGGMDSDYLKPEQEPAIQRLFPAAEFQYIAGAGHWVHSERPQEFIATVTEFLKKDN